MRKEKSTAQLGAELLSVKVEMMWQNFHFETQVSSKEHHKILTFIASLMATRWFLGDSDNFFALHMFALGITSYFCIRDQAYIYYVLLLCGLESHPICNIVMPPPPLWYCKKRPLPRPSGIIHIWNASLKQPFLPWVCLQLFKISMYKEAKQDPG